MRTSLLFAPVLLFLFIFPVNLQAFYPEYHTEIINKELAFLKPGVLEILAEQQELLDSLWSPRYIGHDKWHFNDCDFKGAGENIELLHTTIINSRNSEDSPDTGAIEFGRLLHTVQDFYAHSNWIETIDKGRIDNEIIVPAESKWTEITPWEIQKGGYIPLQYDNNEARIMEDDRIVTVKTKPGHEYPGIVTGIVGWQEACPRGITLRHWGSVWLDSSLFILLDWSADNEKGLNKDHPQRLGFDKAKELAAKQTTAEWCRLVGRLDPGDREKLYIDWVDDEQAADAACSHFAVN